MNTAVARRLALGDRVLWVGKNDYQPSGPGTITRITAHQVEVLWEDETASRYRRAQLHTLRHPKLICELHGGLKLRPRKKHAACFVPSLAIGATLATARASVPVACRS